MIPSRKFLKNPKTVFSDNTQTRDEDPKNCKRLTTPGRINIPNVEKSKADTPDRTSTPPKTKGTQTESKKTESATQPKTSNDLQSQTEITVEINEQ